MKERVITIKKRRLLALFICVCMVFTTLPMVALAEGATVKYINATGWENDEPTGLALSDTWEIENTIAIFVYGADTDTYTTDEKVDGRLLLINNVKVTIGGVTPDSYIFIPGEFRISGSGSINFGNYTVSANALTPEFVTTATADEDLLEAINTFYQSEVYTGEFPSAIYDYTVTGQMVLQNFLEAYNLTITPAGNLQFDPPPEQSEDNPNPPDHFCLEVRNSLSVEYGGIFTSDPSNELLLDIGVQVSGVALYDTDGNTMYAIPSDSSFPYSFFFDSGMHKWVRQDSSPSFYGFRVKYDSNALTTTYKVDDGEPITVQDMEDVEYPESGTVTLSFEPTLGNYVYGIIVFDVETETYKYIKNPEAANALTYSISDFGTSLEIEVVTQLIPFDNEYMIINSRNSEPFFIQNFIENMPFDIDFGEKPYRVQYKINGTNEFVTLDTDSISEPYIYIYTPTTIDGITFYTYWTEEEYNFANLSAEEGEFMVQYQWNGNGSVSHDTETYSDYATYNNQTRVILPNDTTALALTLTRNDNEQTVDSIFQDGLSKDINGDTYTMTLQNNIWSFTEVFFSTDENDDPLTAPIVSFRIQNTDPSVVGSVQYRIGSDVNWSNVTLSLVGGEVGTPYLSAEINEGLTQNDVIHIKATPATNYVIDSVRGVYVNYSTYEPIVNGANDIVTADGFSYTLDQNTAYEFEFGFSQSGSGGGGGDASDSFTITVTAGENGSITPSGVQTVNQGQNRHFDVTPAQGYVIDSVLVDGQPLEVHFGNGAYGHDFNNVTDNHTISATFKEYVADAHSNDPKTLIERKEFAYYCVDPDTAKDQLAKELWYTVFESNANAGDITSINVLEEKIDVASSENPASGLNGQPLYSFRVDLGAVGDDDDDATGIIYALASDREFVVRTTVGDEHTYTVVETVADPSAPYFLVKDFDENGLYVFGNGTSRAPLQASGKGIAGGHILNERIPDFTQIGVILVVYSPDFTGVRVKGYGENNYAAPWGFAQISDVSTTSTTVNAPTEKELYFGYPRVALENPGIPDTIMDSIESVESLLPDGAVTIEEEATNSFTIEFNSAFYDVVKLKITYNLEGGGTREEYLNIRRVGIDIEEYQKNGNDISLATNHGTDPGYYDDDFWTTGGDYTVFGAYYYPSGTSTDDTDDINTHGNSTVSLYATYTWKNGTITTELIDSVSHTDANNHDVAIDDYILYKGTESNAPTKIEVTAVKIGGAENIFAGATLGSGSGVEWLHPPRN